MFLMGTAEAAGANAKSAATNTMSRVGNVFRLFMRVSSANTVLRQANAEILL